MLSAEVLGSFIKDFTIPRRDGNENVKINNRFRRQNNNFAGASHSFVSLPFLHDYDVKLLNFTFSGGRKQATTKFYSLSKLEYGF